jgi:hypothetical protein
VPSSMAPLRSLTQPKSSTPSPPSSTDFMHGCLFAADVGQWTVGSGEACHRMCFARFATRPTRQWITYRCSALSRARSGLGLAGELGWTSLRRAQTAVCPYGGLE